MTSAIESRLSDLARACSRSGEPRFSRFLEPNELALARAAGNRERVSVTDFGGYGEAERRMACFYMDEAPDVAAYPMRIVRMRWNAKYGDCGHRDLLGAVMAQGMERACLGDIALGVGEAFIFATPEAADHLVANMESAGRVTLSMGFCALEDVRLAPSKGREMRATVSSLRLDAVLAEGYDLSRAQAQELIARGLVKRNHVEQTRSDAKLAEGDLISARGHGRLRVLKELGETKKGRFALSLFRYGE